MENNQTRSENAVNYRIFLLTFILCVVTCSRSRSVLYVLYTAATNSVINNLCAVSGGKSVGKQVRENVLAGKYDFVTYYAFFFLHKLVSATLILLLCRCSALQPFLLNEKKNLPLRRRCG